MGYYGFGNLGDEVILDNLRAFLLPHRVIPIQTGFRATRETISRLNAFDLIILGGGGLFDSRPPSPFDNFDRWMNLLEKPLICLGLGVESLASEFDYAAACLIDRARVFQVRDEVSRRILDHSKVLLGPDLTFFRPLSSSIAFQEESLCGVNLRPTRHDVHPWVDMVNTITIGKVALPFSTRHTFDDRKPLGLVIPNCPATFDINIYSSLGIVVGMALHSIVFAVQSGIPVVAISYSSKVRRFMEEVGLQEYVLNYDQVQQFQATFESALTNAESIMQRANSYTRNAHFEIVQLLDDVKREINSISRRQFGVSGVWYEQPLVSIVVLHEGKNELCLEKTILNCKDQTYKNIEIIVVVPVTTLDPDVAHNDSRQDVKVVRVDQPDLGNLLSRSLATCEGQLVSIIVSGAIYAQDAIDILVATISENSNVTVVYADHYLLDDGIIEQLIRPVWPTNWDIAWEELPCLMMSRKAAIETICPVTQVPCSTGLSRRVVDPVHAMHFEQALMFKPTTMFESCIFRSAIAYAQNEIDGAKSLLREAFADVVFAQTSEYDEFLRVFIDAGFEKWYVSDPGAYWETVYDNFPSDSNVLIDLKCIFAAKFSLELAHIYRERGNKCRAIKMYVRALRHNRLATFKGFLRFFLATFIGPRGE